MDDMLTGDVMFLYSLYEYHLRREKALGFAEPSNLLMSIRAALVLIAASRFAKSAIELEEGEKLYSLVAANQKKILRLAKRIRKSRNKKHIRTWYAIILRLYDELEEANKKLGEMADG
jgi:hypothetical protein